METIGKKIEVPARRALRYNNGKRKWALVDYNALEPMVEVLEYGATKYAPDNWRSGFPVRELSESLLRHVFAFLDGEDYDPESGLHHIGHILCNAMFISYNLKHHPDMDDRFRKLSNNTEKKK